MTEVSVGQQWRHVGGDGIPGTGLLLEVVAVRDGSFDTVYPELGDQAPRRHYGTAPLRFYALEVREGRELAAVSGQEEQR